MKQYIVIGAGRFGKSLAMTLYESGQDVLVVDNNKEVVQNLSEVLDNVVVADASDEYTIKKIGLSNFDVAIIAIGTNLRASIMATLLAKESGIPMIISKATDNLQAEVLRKIGANRVVFPEHDMGVKVAKSLTINNLVDYMELDSKHSIFEMKVPHSWIGKSLIDLDVRGKYSLTVIGVKNKDIFDVPANPIQVFGEDDIVVVAGKKDVIEKLVIKESNMSSF
ncbi:MAG: TrkA family potassium uptake protein [Peptostreptococcus porci]|uniref:TrkA family potassium uptake protein n=1 Tax=Peptostreptococcus porci TaxID=2652282 RepID=A0A6N7XEF0_9FIRM|nr:TrkA family potassium uptake protein [Peptostreptococcus porci]MDD7183682.1 TrkA family potassium uptake protein [Peptostreptococcus porci]MDY2795175.1 TrkA family potassium uptake protein [Peptostreptococcus porci]MDY4127436.1 TrkA family potassium uptake protein [Peptostreptococcus porci]MDY5479426.1 TrkA family potassium uptake protein [Peptostreptococcus porci]MDY5964430.1 TrkA family potassium uptake protein [Peptostreptococcus porci]